MKRILFSIVLIFLCVVSINAQSLLDELNDTNISDTIYTEATFKATRVINTQTIESVGKGNFNFIISHRFGNFKSGSYQFYGLDESFIRMGLEYGLSNRLDLGIGRSSEQKLIDCYIKYALFRQSSGAIEMPVTIAWYSSAMYTNVHRSNPKTENLFVTRLFYIHQVMIARKFNQNVSIQITPGMIHRNLVATKKESNIVGFIGLASRTKISKRVSINTEYTYLIPYKIANNLSNTLSIGVDIETGGHVFQLNFSNSRALNEPFFIADNSAKWIDGQVGIGFNIIRHF